MFFPELPPLTRWQRWYWWLVSWFGIKPFYPITKVYSPRVKNHKGYDLDLRQVIADNQMKGPE